MTIKAGDLVMVVHVHCNSGYGGQIEVVEEVRRSWTGTMLCERCGVLFDMDLIARLPGLSKSRAYGENWYQNWYPVAWLKRIDPLSEPEHIERGEEIAA